MSYDLECPFDFSPSLIEFIILTLIGSFVYHLLTTSRNGYLVDISRLSAKQ